MNKPMDGDQKSLEWLIAPLNCASFERDFYEQRLCIVERSAPNYYEGLLADRDLDSVLCANAGPQEVDLVKEGRPTPKSSYTTRGGRVDPLAVRREFSNGATIIFQQLQRRIAPLARLCDSLGSVFSSRIQTNVYLTPSNGLAGFRPHWDTHDVFVLQVLGAKHWVVRGRETHLPLRGQECASDEAAKAPVTDEFELKAGDALYVPRGMIHSARTGDEPSLHITLGVPAFTWTDFFLQGVAAAALESRALRRSLPIGFAGAGLSSTERDRICGEKLQVLLSALDPAELWQYFEGEVSAANRPAVTDVLSECLRADSLGPESRLKRRAGVSVGIEGTAEYCVVRYADGEMRVPARVRQAVELVVGGEQFVVKDLPECLDTEGKLLLVKKLLGEGLLELMSDGAGAGAVGGASALPRTVDSSGAFGGVGSEVTGKEV